MVLVSSLTLERSDAPALMNYVNLLQKNSNLINKNSHWNGFNVLHNYIGRINAFKFRINFNYHSEVPTSKVIYLLGADNFRHEEIPENAYVIY